jgi:hypothetical protein
MCFRGRLQVIAVRDGSKVHISCRDIVVGDISEFRPLHSTTNMPCMFADDVFRSKSLPAARCKPGVSLLSLLLQAS